MGEATPNRQRRLATISTLSILRVEVELITENSLMPWMSGPPVHWWGVLLR